VAFFEFKFVFMFVFSGCVRCAIEHSVTQLLCGTLMGLWHMCIVLKINTYVQWLANSSVQKDPDSEF